MTKARRYATMDLLVNGRFLTRPARGVDRVATELLRALLRQGLPGPFTRLKILVPDPPRPGPVQPRVPPEFAACLVPLPARMGPTLWEQISLLRYHPDCWLLNLCNMAPLDRIRQIVMIHDAQTLTHPHSYSPAFRTWYRMALPRLGHGAAVVLTVSETARQSLESQGVFPRGKAHVVRNGADHLLACPANPAAATDHGLTPGGYFLALNSGGTHKNMALLAALAQMRGQPAAPIACVGGQAPTAFARSGATSGLRHLGRVSDTDLRGLYEQALGVLVPSLSEGFGLPAAEAMHLGCPAVVADRGALPEICGEAAMVLPATDLPSWHRALNRLEHDPGLRADLAARGRARAQFLTWDQAACQLAQVLARLPHPNSPARAPDQTQREAAVSVGLPWH